MAKIDLKKGVKTGVTAPIITPIKVFSILNRTKPVRDFKKRLAGSLIAFLIVVICTVLIYSFLFIYIARRFEGIEYNLITAAYWVVQSMTTVGYGDISPNSDQMMMFSILVQASGVLLLFGIFFPLVATPWLSQKMQTVMPAEVPRNMHDHIIICGYSNMLDSFIAEMMANNVKLVVVDNDKSVIENMASIGLDCIYGEPNDADVLMNARIKYARSLVVNKSDSANADIVLTACEIAPDVEIIAVVEDVSKAKYLEYAGADRVISPKSMYGAYIGDKAMDHVINRITGAVEFLGSLRIVEIPVYPTSRLIGKTLSESRIREETGTNIVGLWDGGVLTLNPGYDMVIMGNSVLLAVGTSSQLSRLMRLTT